VLSPAHGGIMFYFQLVIMAGTVLLAYYFEYTDTFPVHVQGFFCYDKTFSKPYPGPDDASKIPPVLIYSLVTAIPTLTVRVRVLKFALFIKSNASRDSHGAKRVILACGNCCKHLQMCVRAPLKIPLLISSLWFSVLFLNVGHYVSHGFLSLSPAFLPRTTMHRTQISNMSVPARLSAECCCTDSRTVAVHKSATFLSMEKLLHEFTFISMYVTLVFKTKGTRLTKPTISLTLLCLAMLVGVVRVAEYRNHWADVLAGFFTGGAIAVFLVTCVINNFQQILPNLPPPRPQRPESVLGMPMVTLPCVESPLEKLSGPQTPRGSPFTEIT
uniref:Phospholipid phosphatase related 2a n=1 Tax=Gasterosteus aculeatus TaxID=69293 RepID=G3NT08_GASAC